MNQTRVSLWFSMPLLSILFLHFVCESMIIPIIAPTLATPINDTHDMLLGYSDMWHKFFYGFTLASYPIVVFFFAPVIGAVSDTIGKRPVLIIALIFTIIGCILQGFAMEFMSVWILIIGRILVGATAGVDGAIQSALLERCHNEKQRNFYLGASLLSMSIGFMIGPAFSAIFIKEDASAFAWSLPFFILSILFAISLLLIIKKIPSQNKISKDDLKNIKWFAGITDIATLFKIRQALMMILIFVFIQTTAGCYTALSPLVLADKFDFSLKEIATFISLNGLFSALIFGFVGPQMLLRFSKINILRFSIFMCLLSIILLYFEAIGNLVWITPMIMSFGFALSYYVMLSIFSDAADEKRSAWVLSVLSSLWGLTTGIGLLICGIIIGISNEFCIYTCIAFVSIAIILSFKSKGKFNI